MFPMRQLFPLITAMALLAIAPTPAVPQAAAGFVAGTTPDRRPEGAPVLTSLAKDQAWFARALTGVEQPYPDSLRFLDDQGRWFTPFDHRGMTGPYDIRGWYGRE